jgi:hypothetical protein
MGRSLVARLRANIIGQSCVAFVGAGSTTERYYHDGGFYAKIRKEADYPEKDPPPSFPKLMQYFCDQLDGGRHNRLIREAISYIENFCSPGEPNRVARSVSSSLATIPYFNRIVTTNWDPLLEREMDVLVPIVEDRDLAFWDDKKRQVLKIHGCITRPHSIIATQSDYDKCLSRNPLVFNKLKDLMATKTFIFIGYSMRDEDFREIWETITTVLGHFTKLAYAIDPKFTSETAKYWQERGIELIRTYDWAFLGSLHENLENAGLIPSKAFLRFIYRQRKKIGRLHGKLDHSTNGGFASAMYQDGLMHELEDVLSSADLGAKRKEDFEHDLNQAASNVMKANLANAFVEVAYWTGRREVLDRFCTRNASEIPPFFHPAKMVPTPRYIKG